MSRDSFTRSRTIRALKREPGGAASHDGFADQWPDRRTVGPIKRRVSRKARRAHRHRLVAAIASDMRVVIYRRQNEARGARNTDADGLTPAQRRRIRHKENAGRRG